MRQQRKVETLEERNQRFVREAQIKKDGIAADDAAIDQMIKRNIEQYGP